MCILHIFNRDLQRRRNIWSVKSYLWINLKQLDSAFHYDMLQNNFLLMPQIIRVLVHCRDTEISWQNAHKLTVKRQWIGRNTLSYCYHCMLTAASDDPQWFILYLCIDPLRISLGFCFSNMTSFKQLRTLGHNCWLNRCQSTEAAVSIIILTMVTLCKPPRSHSLIVFWPYDMFSWYDWLIGVHVSWLQCHNLALSYPHSDVEESLTFQSFHTFGKVCYLIPHFSQILICSILQHSLPIDTSPCNRLDLLFSRSLIHN